MRLHGRLQLQGEAGFEPWLFLSLIGHFLPTKYFIVSTWPKFAAICNPESPRLFVASMSALFSANIFVTSKNQALQAKWSGVAPSLFFLFTFPPCCMSNSRICGLFCLTAKWTLVQFPLNSWLTFAPLSIAKVASLSFPFRTARLNSFVQSTSFFTIEGLTFGFVGIVTSIGGQNAQKPLSTRLTVMLLGAL